MTLMNTVFIFIITIIIIIIIIIGYDHQTIIIVLSFVVTIMSLCLRC